MLDFCSVVLFVVTLLHPFSLFFFFNDTATTEIYTLSLHDALPISKRRPSVAPCPVVPMSVMAESCVAMTERPTAHHGRLDRKSTRLNSSHSQISYAVFCLKKKHIEG